MVTFRVNDMTCGRCAQTLGAALAAVQGSTDVVIDVARKLVQVAGSAAAGELAAAIEKAGYTPEKVEGLPRPRPASPAGGCCGGGRQAASEVGQTPRPASSACCG